MLLQESSAGFFLTDDELSQRARLALMTSGYPLLRNLNVFCDNGRVTLQGRLPTYFLKQVAQTIMQQLDGVHDVDNDVRVHGPR